MQEGNSSDTRNEARSERAPRGEGRRERGEGRRERGERRPNGAGNNNAPEGSENFANVATAGDAAELKVTESAPGEERAEGANGTPERRERRSRDRYGRDRRERNAHNDSANSESAQAPATSADSAVNDEAPVATRSYFDRGLPSATDAAGTTTNAPLANAAPVATPVAASPVKPVEAAPAAPAASAVQGMPIIQNYVLPMAELVQVAESSGLQWVNSDPAKIAQVQAAIAAEPKPLHVPRERPPLVVLDEGPLVLVETRKDLSDMKLPF